MNLKIPYISVIVPAYNEQKYIAACLNSLTQQICTKSYEIIVVNNNSSDDTKSIVQKFSTVNLIDQPIAGLAITRNTGWRAAKGDILVFIDSDCIVKPNHLEKIVGILGNNPNLAAVTGPYIYHDGGPLVRFITQSCQYFRWYWVFMKNIFGLQLLIGGNVAFRRRAFVALNGFDESIRDINDPEDFEIAFRCKKRGLTVAFDHTLEVISSYRRLNRAILREGFVRAIYRNKRLWKYLARGI